MRLGTLLLIGAAALTSRALTQERPVLGWERIMPLAWGVEPSLPVAPASPQLQPSFGPRRARLEGDGSFQISDARGRILLRSALPGRPLQVWRDGGVPLPTPTGVWGFPLDSPLSHGLGALQWCSGDFRPFLRGLLWVMEDGEGFLTVLHPATARAIHLPLPPGRDLHLRFLADRLVVQAGDVERGAPSQWSLPWIGFLPRLADLCPQPQLVPPGGALAPFPRIEAGSSSLWHDPGSDPSRNRSLGHRHPTPRRTP